jgi:hypothetical protein
MDNFLKKLPNIKMILMSGDKYSKMMDYKISLQRHYDSLSHSQAVRIIGFVTGLFTLLQFCIDLVRFVIFLIPIFILLFFIFRSIFRFAVFSAHSEHIRGIEEKDIKNLEQDEVFKGKNMMVLLDFATSYKISGNLKKNGNENYPRLSLYKFFYYDWFMSGNNSMKGFFICAGLSLISIFILLALLW